jgi:predicted dehydrogenase
MAANQQARQKGLAVAVGHHLRHEEKHQEIVRRIHEGQLGEVLFLRAYFNTGSLWIRPRQTDQTEMQYQVRNWYYFNWLSGDHIVEQHVHDLDVCNWIQQAHPVEAQGMGGRQVRIDKECGEIFDHHAVEFTYANGTKLFSYCRQTPNCWSSFSQHAHGTLGTANFEGHGTTELRIGSQSPQRWKRGIPGHQVEQDHLLAAILGGRAYNEADYGATSTMTAILGRMASSGGQLLSWDEALNSTLELGPLTLAWDATPPVKPNADGLYPCALPGITKVV